MSLRIGQGYDVHAFEDVSPPESAAFITIGGERIEHRRSLAAHSDGDVLLHAICDALLGALALGDIGQHFPDSDDQYENVDSRNLLRHCVALVHENGYQVINIDATIIAQAPRMAEHTFAMRKNIAGDARITVDAVSVKSTTTEKLGFCGREEGVACMAVALLQRTLKTTPV